MTEPRSSKKNLGDRVLLASWTTVYSVLLLGFGILKELERFAEPRRALNSTDREGA